jgi:predicted nucleic acid-binding protein
LKIYVLDASVAVKWILPETEEPFSAEAKRLMKRALDGDAGLVVPDIFWAELANVIWKGRRRGRLDGEDVASAMASLMSLDVQVAGTGELIPAALEAAMNLNIAVYDACYVELANRLNVSLVTADRELFARTAPELPVLWIGAIH